MKKLIFALISVSLLATLVYATQPYESGFSGIITVPQPQKAFLLWTRPEHQPLDLETVTLGEPSLNEMVIFKFEMEGLENATIGWSYTIDSAFKLELVLWKSRIVNLMPKVHYNVTEGYFEVLEPNETFEITSVRGMFNNCRKFILRITLEKSYPLERATFTLDFFTL